MVCDRVDVQVNQITPRTCAAYQLSDDASNSNAVTLFMVRSSDDPPEIPPSHVFRIVLCLECKLSSSSFPYDTIVYRWWDWTVPLQFSLLSIVCSLEKCTRIRRVIRPGNMHSNTNISHMHFLHTAIAVRCIFSRAMMAMTLPHVLESWWSRIRKELIALCYRRPWCGADKQAGNKYLCNELSEPHFLLLPTSSASLELISPLLLFTKWRQMSHLINILDGREIQQEEL